MGFEQAGWAAESTEQPVGQLAAILGQTSPASQRREEQDGQSAGVGVEGRRAAEPYSDRRLNNCFRREGGASGTLTRRNLEKGEPKSIRRSSSLQVPGMRGRPLGGAAKDEERMEGTGGARHAHRAAGPFRPSWRRSSARVAGWNRLSPRAVDIGKRRISQQTLALGMDACADRGGAKDFSNSGVVMDVVSGRRARVPARNRLLRVRVVRRRRVDRLFWTVASATRRCLDGYAGRARGCRRVAIAQSSLSSSKCCVCVLCSRRAIAPCCCLWWCCRRTARRNGEALLQTRTTWRAVAAWRGASHPARRCQCGRRILSYLRPDDYQMERLNSTPVRRIQPKQSPTQAKLSTAMHSTPSPYNPQHRRI